MSGNKSYTERLKKMKESIEGNKELLKQKFPDDVPTTGNPDLVRDKDESEPGNHVEGAENEAAGS
jgi:hypothetical protein